MDEIFNTESHEKELDMMFSEASTFVLEKEDDDVSVTKDFYNLHQLKINFRYARKVLFKFL